MEPVRPLRDVLAGLAEPGPDGAPLDARAELAAGGHGDLPDDLLVTAIAGYAGTAPAEVAEHLAPFLDAPDAATGLDLLTTAPAGPFEGEVPLDDADTLGDPEAADGVDDLDGAPGLLGAADGLDDLDGLDSLDDLDAGPGAGHAPEAADDVDAPAFGDTGTAGLDDTPADLDAPAGDDVPTGFDDTFGGDVAAADLFDTPGFGPVEQAPADDAADADDLDDLDG